MEQVYSVSEEFLSIWNRYIVFQRSVYPYGTGIYSVPEECLSIWNRYIVFQRSVYLYGTGI